MIRLFASTVLALVPLYQPMREWTYAPTNDHQPHVLVINYTWDIPGATGGGTTPSCARRSMAGSSRA